jgi:hypothetical protein
MEREPSEFLLRSMVTHLKFLARDANVCGFQSMRNSHGAVLSDMEDGLITWADRDAIAECRKTNLIPTVPTQCEPVISNNRGNNSNNMNNSLGNNVKTSNNYQSNARQLYNKNRPQLGKTGQPCWNFNKNRCRYENDHESDNWYWRHICCKCLREGHVMDNCPKSNQ